jgi:hypothetical protein
VVPAAGEGAAAGAGGCTFEEDDAATGFEIVLRQERDSEWAYSFSSLSITDANVSLFGAESAVLRSFCMVVSAAGTVFARGTLVMPLACCEDTPMPRVDIASLRDWGPAERGKLVSLRDCGPAERGKLVSLRDWGPAARGKLVEASVACTWSLESVSNRCHLRNEAEHGTFACGQESERQM